MSRRVKDTKENAKEKAKSRRASSVVEETDSVDKLEISGSEKSEKLIDKQVKIDQMLTHAMDDKKESKGKCLDDIVAAIHSLEVRLGKLASKEYIDKSLQKLVSADFVNEKMKELREDLSKEIKLELDKAYDSMRKVKEKLAESQNTIEVLQDRCTGMQIQVDNVLKKNEKLVKETKELSERLIEKDVCIKAQERSLNDLEQYTRRNSVRIYGLLDKDKSESIEATCNLVISTLNTKLKLKLAPRDIDISHRLGKFSPDANRPVICKFVSRVVKKNVMSVRRQLKGTSIIIREDLTQKNAKLLEEVSAKDGIQNAWSDDGKILAILLNGKKMRFDIHSDLRKPLIPADELSILLATKNTRL